jgi:hypothetical protein
MEPSNTNYIYLLHEREFIKTSEYIYKVGMTRQSNLDRIKNYPRGSVLLFQMECYDCKFVESIVLKKFDDMFHKCSFYGNEYYRGNKRVMMSVIYLIIENEREIRECTTDRNGYIDNILKNVNKPIELSDIKIIENNSEGVNCIIVDDKPNLEECRNIENQEIKDCDTIQYYTHDDMNKIIQAAISAGDGCLVRACMKAMCAFTFNDFDNDLIPFKYDKDVSNYKIMNVVNIKKPKQKRTCQSIKI